MRIPAIPVKRHSDWMFLMVEHDPQLGWRMRRNIEATLDMFGTQSIPICTNEAGFRDEEFEDRGRRGILRVALLGDSFTWGTGVRDEERFGNALERLDRGCDCMNFGLPAFGADQALLTWRHVTSKLAPNLVVLTIYTNDYTDNMHVTRWGRPKPYFLVSEDGALELRDCPVPESDFWDNGVLHEIAPEYAVHYPTRVTRRSRVAHWLVKRSDLARVCQTALASLAAPQTAARPQEHAPLNAREKEQVRLMTALVGQLQADVSGSGARLLVLLAGDWNPRYEAQVRDFDRTGIASLDVTTRALSREFGIGREEAYSARHGHWTPAGHSGVAKLLRRWIGEAYEQPS